MSNTSRHLTYFKVENFKRFESFEMKDLGQFNLIVGDNNVGKTSVLEALLVDESPQQFAANLFQALKIRNLKSSVTFKDLEFFYRLASRLPIEYQREITFEFTNDNEDKKKLIVAFDISNQLIQFRNPRIPKLSHQYQLTSKPANAVGFKSPFISFEKSHDVDITRTYVDHVQNHRSTKSRILKALKLFIPDIESLDVYTEIDSDNYPYLKVTRSGSDFNLPLALFGEGSIKIAKLVMELVVQSGKRLMIDEVDAGIHYSRFKEFWKVILKAAQENDVQLFMTTHSKECMQYFVEALSEPDMKDLQRDARSISLVELPDKSVKAYTYFFEHLEANLALGSEVR